MTRPRLAAVGLIVAALASAARADHVPGMVLVKVRSGAAEALAQRMDAAPLAEIEGRVFPAPAADDRVGLARIFALSVPGGSEALWVESLASEPWVEWSSLNGTDGGVTGQLVPDDPFYGQQWHLDQVSDIDIDAPEGWALRGTFNVDSSLVIAFIDTGYEVGGTSPEFAGSLWTNPDETADGTDEDGNLLVDDLHGYDFVNDDPDANADHPHGVNTSGLLAANTGNAQEVASVAPGARLMHLKAFDFNGDFPPTGPWAGHLSAAVSLTYATDKGADVINNSWYNGSTSSQVINDAIQYALDNGVRVVFGAANDNSDMSWPGEYPGLIVVAAIDFDGQKSWFSNYGTWVHLSAPGNGLITTSIGPWGPTSFSGTSGSCPLVAGIVAHLLSEDGDLTQDELLAILQQAATDVEGFNPGHVGLLGAGIANLANSLQLMEGVSDLGQALSGNSAPRLNAWGDSSAGGKFTWSLSGAEPNAPGALAFGASAWNLALLGGVLVPALDVVVPITTDTDGGYVFEHVLGAPLAPGASIYAQYGGADLGAPQLIQLSNAVLVSG